MKSHASVDRGPNGPIQAPQPPMQLPPVPAGSSERHIGVCRSQPVAVRGDLAVGSVWLFGQPGEAQVGVPVDVTYTALPRYSHETVVVCAARPTARPRVWLRETEPTSERSCCSPPAPRPEDGARASGGSYSLALGLRRGGGMTVCLGEHAMRRALDRARPAVLELRAA